MQDVAEMRGREKNRSYLKRLSSSKRMREVSLHCYQAEEELTTLELLMLKNELEVTEPRWRGYKTALTRSFKQHSLFRVYKI